MAELIGPKLPVEHERYTVRSEHGKLLGYNFSAWARENEQQEPYKFQVGDHVVICQVVEITKVCRDCDGTPLYALDGGRCGYSDSGFVRMATEKEAMWQTVIEPVNFKPE